MKIGFIGAGNVGTSLGKYFTYNNIPIVGYYSLVANDTLDAAGFTYSECYNSLEELISNCDTLFLTVNDDSIIKIVEKLKSLAVSKKILIHTSGAKSSLIFDSLRDDNYCYSIHPIYAFCDKYNDYKSLNKASFTIEGNEEKIDDLINLFKQLGNRISKIKSEDKIKYHAACVMMSNLVNGLINTSFNLLKDIGIDDTNMFNYLIENNIKNILEKNPTNALTGPVDRNDLSTVAGHLDSLEGNYLEIYRLLSAQLIAMAKQKHKDYDYASLSKIIGGNE